MEQYKVLMIDDDELIARSTAEYFNILDVKTAYVTSFDAAVDFLGKNNVSLLLLDINLGGESGFELCQKIRLTMDVPIFFVSARSSEDDMLLALSIGGDDYICKPYSLSVLLAKVKAELKRYESSQSKQAEDKIILGKSEISLKKATITKDGTEYPLKAMEYKLLVYLLNNRNRVIPKDEIFEKIWDTQFVGDVTLNVHIRHLREKLEEDPGNPKYIKTVWGVGFILNDE